MSSFRYCGPQGIGTDALYTDAGTSSSLPAHPPMPLGVGISETYLRVLRGDDPPQNPADVFPFITGSRLKQFFDPSASRNIAKYFEIIVGALRDKCLCEREMVFLAFGTIAAESAGFAPINEQPSQYNTTDLSNTESFFDKYENNDRLGNTSLGDGARFKGRGFIQLTGRYNYAYYGPRLEPSVNLVADPEKANDPEIAAKLLALFIWDKKATAIACLRDTPPDYAGARKLVNGGSHGLEAFTRVYAQCVDTNNGEHMMFAALSPEELILQQCRPLNTNTKL